LSRIARKIATFSIGQFVISCLGMVVLFLLSRGFGQEGLGLLAIAMSCIGLFEQVNKAGFNVAHLKRIGEGLPRDRGLTIYLLVKVVLTSLFAVCVILLVNGTTFISQYEGSGDIRLLTWILLAVTCARNLADVPIQTLAAQRRTTQQLASMMIPALVRMGGVLVIVTSRLPLPAVPLAYLAGELLSIIAAWYFLGRFRFTRPRMADLKSYTSIAAPMMVVALSAGIERHLDKLVLGIFAGSAAVGIYFGAMRLMSFVEVMGTGITTLLLPTISSMTARDDGKRALDLVATTEKYSALVFFPGGIFIWIAAEPIMGILGPGFSEGGNALRLVAMASILSLVTIPQLEYITGSGRAVTRMWISISFRIINLVAIVVFITDGFGPLPGFALGCTGAALARLVARLSMFLLARAALFRLTFDGRSCLRSLHYLGAAVLLIALAHRLPPLAQTIPLALSVCLLAPACILSYWCILWVTGGIRLGDLKGIVDILKTPGRGGPDGVGDDGESTRGSAG